MFPKPLKGSAKKAKRKRKRELDNFRRQVNIQVLEMDQFTCQHQHCGKPACHAHHVWGRGGEIDSWREQPESRISLCNDCHYAVHHGGELTRDDIIEDLSRAIEKRGCGPLR